MTQEQALKVLKTGGSVFLTGEPGSGKTHTVNAYVRYLRECAIEPAITASTGIAATHIGGMTIHSWSGIGIKNALTEYDVDKISTTEYVVKRIGKAKVLIIDEISMLDADTLTSIDKVLRAVKMTEEPFGGMQVILVGDFFQLPPVSKFGQKKSLFAFESPSWTELNPLILYITEQHRQEDGVFLSLLSALRRNEINEDHLETLNERIQQGEQNDMENETREITKLYSHNEDVDTLNRLELKKVEGEEKLYRMRTEGREALVAALVKGCLSPSELILKKGAVVMFTKNSQKGEYVNGTLGNVVGFDSVSKFPIIETRSGRQITAEPAEWIVEEGGKQLASIKQIPLRLAWAMTVHKSQGMSLDAAFVDLRNAFVEGQGYVALSRVRTLAGLYLAGYNAAALRVHPEVLEKDAEFRAHSERLEDKFNEIEIPELLKIQKNFVISSGGKFEEEERGIKGVKGKRGGIKGGKKGDGGKGGAGNMPANAGKKWASEDDELLKKEFENGTSITKLMKMFGRKRGGITARLEKHGLIEPND
jgi:ATP-dependent DNA helicase PIF1